jgi:hypothetical protein
MTKNPIKITVSILNCIIKTKTQKKINQLNQKLKIKTMDNEKSNKISNSLIPKC